MSYKEIKVERNGPVAVLTFNRPSKANSMTPSMGEEIKSVLEEIDASEGVRVLVVKGKGEFFYRR